MLGTASQVHALKHSSDMFTTLEWYVLVPCFIAFRELDAPLIWCSGDFFNEIIRTEIMFDMTDKVFVGR